MIKKPVNEMMSRYLHILFLATIAFPPIIHAGTLEPSAAPGPTMRTLEELKPDWNRIIPVDQRFVDALDGNAVLDKETGLVWAKSPDTTQRNWQAAVDYCIQLSLAGRKGWRLPTGEELASLIDPNAPGAPKLPSGHPFQNVQISGYWSSSTNTGDAGYAWGATFESGLLSSSEKTGSQFVWPVRSGK